MVRSRLVIFRRLRGRRFRGIWTEPVTIPAITVSFIFYFPSHNLTFHLIVNGEEEYGALTTKGAAEINNEKDTNYKDTLKERQGDLHAVKTFQNKQRIVYGRLDDKEPENRKRQSSDTRPIESYEKLLQQRNSNANNSNKTNFFINENEPAFINSMSRTMDAFDLRMSTFGGKPSEKLTK